MRDALTILVVHISRQQGQPLLHVGQEFRLKAGADFFQRIDEPRHFVGPDPTVKPKPIEPGPSPPAPRRACPAPSHYEGVAPRLLIFRSMTCDRFVGGEPSIAQFVLTSECLVLRRLSLVLPSPQKLRPPFL